VILTNTKYEKLSMHGTTIRMGADPEFFLVDNDDNVIESSRFLENKKLYDYDIEIVNDGVPLEFHPMATHCRENFGKSIGRGFAILNESLKNNKNIKISFNEIMKLPKEVLDKLSASSRAFGCKPSYNAYTGLVNIARVNPDTYPYRSAGGHIHLGFYDKEFIYWIHKNPQLVAKILDRVCGNICVLLDRNPSQKLRREVYGMAGEYRLPDYGIEYRVPSNFWLCAYPIMSLVIGLARFGMVICYNIFINEKESKVISPYRDILTLCSDEDIQCAINNNNFTLAYSNYKAIKKFILEIVNEKTYYYPLCRGNISQFEKFIKHGISYYFDDNVIERWLTISRIDKSKFTIHGWNYFLNVNV
jgi:hypothetical protein